MSEQERPRLALIITADDLGYCTQRDDGIFEIAAVTRGAMINHASLLVGGVSARDAVARAHAAALPLGLHLNLTEGTPAALRVFSRLPSSLVVAGTNEMLGKFGLREALALGRVDLDDVVLEATAQLQLFHTLTGSHATHFDGHQHVHTIPELASVLAPLMHRHGVRSTRISDTEWHLPLAWPQCASSDVANDASGIPSFLRAVSAEAEQSRAIYSNVGITSTHFFIGLTTMGANATVPQLEYLLSELDARAARHAHEGVLYCEWMVHPGNHSIEGDAFNQAPERQHEKLFLLDDATRTLIERYCVHSSWSEVSDGLLAADTNHHHAHQRDDT